MTLTTDHGSTTEMLSLEPGYKILPRTLLLCYDEVYPETSSISGRGPKEKILLRFTTFIVGAAPKREGYEC